MLDQLTVTLIQKKIFWKDISKNLESLGEKIHAISEHTDLIILPEMFSTGFVMEPNSVAETMDGSTVSWMQETAKEKKTALIGSLIIEENQQFFNRLVFVHPSGTMAHYDKRHLFTLAGEDKIYTAGEIRLLFEYKGWKICPFICYDLRFPVWSRNTENYDVAIYIANWPKARINAWNSLLNARAIENMCYVVGVNRIGTDSNNIEYPGHSQIIDPLGEVLHKAAKEEESLVTFSLKKERINTIRNKFQFLNDQDQFTII